MSSPSDTSESQTSQSLARPRADASFWTKANHRLNAEIKTSREDECWLPILVIIRGVEVQVTTTVLFMESHILPMREKTGSLSFKYKFQRPFKKVPPPAFTGNRIYHFLTHF